MAKTTFLLHLRRNRTYPYFFGSHITPHGGYYYYFYLIDEDIEAERGWLIWSKSLNWEVVKSGFKPNASSFQIGVLSHHANNNKPSVFKGCSVWHEINLGSVTAGQQMAHSIGLFKLSLRQRIFTKVYARYRKATRIRQYPNTSKTISTLWGRVESGSYQTAKGQSLMARDARQDKRLSRKEES